MKSLLQFNDVHFAYGQHEVLCGINFELQPEDFIALVGSNGSGKSTLLKLILGFLSPQHGTIVDNAKTIGYVPQGGLLNVSSFPANVLEVVMLRLDGNSFFSSLKKSRKETALKALKHVGMDAYATAMIPTLSGGQLQRVLIAREIAVNPELLILDEPTNGLDEQSIADLFKLLKHLNTNHNMTVMIVNHDIEEVSHHVNRMVRLKNKKIEEVTL